MEQARPVVKWVGGKRQLLPKLLPHLSAMGAPDGVWKGRYYEPFIGGGAALFALAGQPGFHAIINDYNAELVGLYRQIQADPLALLDRLGSPEFANTAEAHATVRAWDRQADWPTRSALDKAARFIYLNRTSFNGLYRVNAKGFFNAPFGRYKSPGFPSLPVLQAAQGVFAAADIRQGDFEAAVADVQAGDVVYFDPPYIPVSASSSFVGYTDQGFDGGMQERLANLCDHLTDQGVGWAVSNADVPLARAFYGRQRGVQIHEVMVRRPINSQASGRGAVGEIIAVCPPS